MRHLLTLLFLFSPLAAAEAVDSTGADRCAAILHAESIRSMGHGELAARRLEVKHNYAKAAAAAICESSASITYDGYRQLLDQARQENRQAGGTGYDTAELYFFLECGEDQVNLSPLAYHGFNLNRDDYGFLGEATLAIAWMSIGYLDTKDPGYNRSFMDIVNRVLAYARKQESETEIEMYEALLQEIEGFREDYIAAVDECRESER
jgi:hypothetical protein